MNWSSFSLACVTANFRARKSASKSSSTREHYLHTDAGRLQQIMWNVIKNAAKFTEAGGEVRITTKNDADDNAILTVTDNGIGMTPETINRLFNAFEQGEKVISRRFGGLGLGMAISLGPCQSARRRANREERWLGKGSPPSPLLSLQPFPKRRCLTSARSTAKNRLPVLKILLVEDHNDSALALTQLLSKQGYLVARPTPLPAPWKRSPKRAFDVLICDIGLPDGTGFQLMETVRKKSATPAIALSGFGMEEDVAQSASSGFDAHLTKPVNFHNLEAAIRKLTARS